ncbi:MAG: hypothetical protein M3Q99_08875 [Acidobacteriota bacterium]|nr:hypothetical protein [Acidobacteriota bacterium]
MSFTLILLITFGGLALTYLFAEDEPILWRLAAGNIVGSAVFGLVGFVVANFFGLSAATVTIALLIALSPLLLFRRKRFRRRFWGDWKQAIHRNQGVNAKKIRRLAYYIFFFLLFAFFFDRAMFEMNDGIYTGGSQNLGDLPFHLGAIFSFTEGSNFPPQNPSFAGAKFSYPFIADFLSACFVKLGANVKDAMLIQNIFWAFSLLVILERFVFKFTNKRFAAKIAPALLFFSGGFGFLWFLNDFWQSSQGFFDFLHKLPRDYTIGEKFRWGNSLITLFITQRSLLIGMPLTIIVLQKLWTIFNHAPKILEEEEKGRKGEKEKEREKRENYNIKTDANDRQNSSFPLLLFSSSPFLVGLLAGTLPLIHLHSLVVLFVVAAFLFFIKPKIRRELTAFGIGVGLIAVPALLWTMAGSATRTSEFFGWHFGWNKGADGNFIWFWLKNTGIFIPILIAGIYLIYSARKGGESEIKSEKREAKEKNDAEIQSQSANQTSRILFYLPFIFLFLLSNAAKLAPWEWDNIKVLIYWFVGSLPFAAFALAWLWRGKVILKIAAAVCFAVLIFAGSLDVWRVVSEQINYKVFETDAVAIARDITLRTPPNALFLNAPTYNSAIVLSGRRSLMRYPGHLSSHGIDYAERENDLKRIYEGSADTASLLRKYNIEYVLISPEERKSLAVNEQYFAKYPILAESGLYRVYKIK